MEYKSRVTRCLSQCLIAAPRSLLVSAPSCGFKPGFRSTSATSRHNTCTTGAAILALQAPQYVHYRRRNTCTTGAAIRALQAPQYVHYRRRNTCTTGAAIRALQAPQYVHYRRHNTCTTGAAIRALQAPQYVHYRRRNTCTTGVAIRALQAPQYVHYRRRNTCTTGAAIRALQAPRLQPWSLAVTASSISETANKRAIVVKSNLSHVKTRFLKTPLEAILTRLKYTVYIYLTFILSI